MKQILCLIISLFVLTMSTASAGMILKKKVMTYDAFNRMTSYELQKPDGQGGWTTEKTESYGYRGADWHRSSLTSGGVTTSFLYDGDNVIADIVNGQVVRSYVTAMLDSNLSMTVYSDSTLEASGYQLPAVFYYNQDERQSVKNLTDSTGVIAQSYDYTAYGDQINFKLPASSLKLPNRYTYTGRELNDVSGAYYFRYRMYGAQLGGFLSRDILGYVDGYSKYSGWFASRLRVDSRGLSSEVWVYADETRFTIKKEPPEIPRGNDGEVFKWLYSGMMSGDHLWKLMKKDTVPTAPVPPSIDAPEISNGISMPFGENGKCTTLILIGCSVTAQSIISDNSSQKLGKCSHIGTLSCTMNSMKESIGNTWPGGEMPEWPDADENISPGEDGGSVLPYYEQIIPMLMNHVKKKCDECCDCENYKISFSCTEDANSYFEKWSQSKLLKTPNPCGKTWTYKCPEKDK